MKCGRKWYKTYTYVTKNKLYNPVKQSLGHVYALKKITKEWPHLLFIPIVVFSDKADLSKVNSVYEVIYEDQLLDTIQEYRTIYLSNTDVQKIVDRIKVQDYREIVSDSEHVRNIHYAKKEKEDKLASGMLVERQGPYGSFIGCSNYPKCKFTTH